MIDRCLQDDVARSKLGDEKAFSRIVRECYPIAYRFARRILRDDQETEDIVQEAFVRVWTNLYRIDPEKKFTTLLYRIVSNLCIDRARATKTMFRTSSISDDKLADSGSADCPDDIHANAELASIVRRLMLELPPKQMLVFSLRDLEDLPVEEVVHITGLSKDKVKANLYYARATIRRSLRVRYSIDKDSL